MITMIIIALSWPIFNLCPLDFAIPKYDDDYNDGDNDDDDNDNDDDNNYDDENHKSRNLASFQAFIPHVLSVSQE